MINKIVELGYSRLEAEELIKVSKDIESDYNKLLEKYPIQYLIGYVDFYGYKINVNENVLIPRYETEFLVEKTIKYSKQYLKDKIETLDIGTGSGAIAISISKELNSNVDAIDISEKALEVAKNNSKINNTNINFIKSDILSNIKDKKYNLIISNPPYIRYDEEIMDSVKMYEPHLALYAKDEGLYFYKEIINNIKPYLMDEYIIAFEIGYEQGNELLELCTNSFKEAKVLLEKDLSDKDRYIFIIKEK